MRITKSRIMRGKGINPNPPICRSKERTQCSIYYYDCTDGHEIGSFYQENLTLEQCKGYLTANPPSRSKMIWYDPNIHQVVEDEADTCVVYSNYIKICSYESNTLSLWMTYQPDFSEKRGTLGAQLVDDNLNINPDSCPLTYQTWYWNNTTPDNWRLIVALNVPRNDGTFNAIVLINSANTHEPDPGGEICRWPVDFPTS